eukprot:6704784-Alexandrium_andersonii.AAC.1
MVPPPVGLRTGPGHYGGLGQVGLNIARAREEVGLAKHQGPRNARPYVRIGTVGGHPTFPPRRAYVHHR